MAKDLGLGLLWTWMGVVWLGLPRIPQDTPGSLWLLWLSISLGIAGALLVGPTVCGMRGMRIAQGKLDVSSGTERPNGTRISLCLVAALGMAAQLLMVLLPAGGASMLAGRCVLGAACGAGGAILMQAWACRMVAFDADYLELLVPMCSLLSVFTVVLAPLPDAVYWLVCASLYFSSGLMLVLCHREGVAPAGAGKCPYTADEDGKDRRVAILDVARVAVVTCASYMFIKHAGGSPFDPAYANSGIWNGLPHLFGVLMAVGIAFLSISHFKRLTMVAIMKIVTPALVIAALLLLKDDSVCTSVAGILMAVAETPLIVFVMLWALTLARKNLVDIRMGFGLLMGAAQLGILLGSVLLAPGDGTGLDDALVTPVLCGVFVLTCSIVPSEARRDEMTKTHTIADCAQAVLTTPEVAPEPLTFDGACEGIAQECGLSARELEVLRLLARGHGRAYIRDELVISKNTIATHARHIYQKTGTHAQQELIVLVQERLAKKG